MVARLFHKTYEMNFFKLSVVLFFTLAGTALVSCSDDESNDKDPSAMPGNTGKYEAVDLGLSVRWAACNVGADSPHESGSLYAWGETEPKDEYKIRNYKYWGNMQNQAECMRNITKYCTNEDYGTIDELSVLTTDDDVAHIEMGGDWRMPTVEEVNELYRECTIELSTLEDAVGVLITGPNGNSIFVPNRTVWGYPNDGIFDEYGGFWSSSLCEKYEQSQAQAYAFYFYNMNGRLITESNSTRVRSLGLAVRGVIK